MIQTLTVLFLEHIILTYLEPLTCHSAQMPVTRLYQIFAGGVADGRTD